jgi:hypothetical protein
MEFVVHQRPQPPASTLVHSTLPRRSQQRLRPLAAGLLVALGVLGTPAMADPGDIPHPSLIVTNAEIPALRARATQAPYASIRAQAVNTANNAVLPVEATTAANIGPRAARFASIISGTALAYLLETDPARRTTYRNKIVSQLGFWNPNAVGSLSAHYLLPNPPTGDWNYNTPTSNAFFQSVLAVDIIYNDLTPAQRTQLNGWLAIPGNYYTARRINWVTAGLSARGIWALYNNNTTAAATAIDDYLTETKLMITPDGVFDEGTGYAVNRWFNPDRENKSSFGNLITRRGLIARAEWYADPRLVAYMEWLNGYSHTPARVNWAIGDSGPGRFATWLGNAHNARSYSVEAGRYEAWLKKDIDPKGLLTSYVFSDETPASEARVAPSRIFPSGGAYFRQVRPVGTSSEQDLAGVLHNPRFQGRFVSHTHKEVNSLHLAGYGQLLLRGSGYNGWGAAYQGFSFNYINRRAVSGNVALIDYQIERDGGTIYTPSATNDHRDTSPGGTDGKFGRGVTGLVTGVVDIATGSTADGANGLDALPNGNHLRHFFFVQPSGSIPGYFASFDRVTANADYTPRVSPLQSHLVWHPNGNVVTTRGNESEYEWSIAGNPNVRLIAFLATPTSARRLVDGALVPDSIGKYLFASYPMNANRVAQTVTVLYPYVNGNAATPRPIFTRLAGTGFTGGRVTQTGGVVDSFFETQGANEAVPFTGARVRGSASMIRQVNGALRYYAATSTNTLRVGDRGFESPSFITAVIDGGAGNVSIPSGGATVTFYAPSIAGVEVDGVREPAAARNGGVTVALDSGNHRIRLVGVDAIVANGSAPLLRPH